MEGVATLLKGHFAAPQVTTPVALNHQTRGGHEILALNRLVVPLSMFAGSDRVISVKTPHTSSVSSPSNMAAQRPPASCWPTDRNGSTHPEHDGVEEEEELEENIGKPLTVADITVAGHGGEEASAAFASSRAQLTHNFRVGGVTPAKPARADGRRLEVNDNETSSKKER